MPKPLLVDTVETVEGSFVEALDKMTQTTSPMINNVRKDISLGENGQPEISFEEMSMTAEGSLLAIYGGLLRDSNITKVSSLLSSFIKSLESLDDNKRAEYARYLLCLIFYTRDCRGGKGERHIFRSLFIESYKYFPKTIEALVQHIPYYGYWKDLNEILLAISVEDQNLFLNLRNIIYAIMASQLRIDSDNYNLFMSDQKIALERGESFHHKLQLTLLAKWVPKEGSSYDRKIRAAKEIAILIFPAEFKTDFRMALKSYRKMISALNKAIHTTEILMCEKRFSEIQFKLVPGKCLTKYRRAFLNQELHGEKIRYPDNDDRINCRENLIKFMDDIKNGKKKINANQLFIHEIVEKYYHHIIQTHKLSDEEIELYELCWNEITKVYQEQINRGEISLQNGIILADVSGSMEGIPMFVSIASAIFISNLIHDPFRDRFLTFDTNPQWFVIDPTLKLIDKVRLVMNSPWGGSTNFEKAMNLILDTARAYNLGPDEMPKWFLVVSDMQFDNANSSNKWETMHEHIQDRFTSVGMKICGKPYDMPHIIYWNVRGNTNGLPVITSQLGCQLVSGYNISILKEIFKHQDLTKISPWTSLESTLNNTRYDLVRKTVASIAEKPYFEYFGKQEPELVEEEDPVKTSTGLFSYISSWFKL